MKRSTEYIGHSEIQKYFYVIHGDVPAILMPQVAYRTVRGYKRTPRKLKAIKCPYCKNTFTEVDKSTNVELYRYPARKNIKCHSYPTCQICKNEIGMILA